MQEARKAKGVKINILARDGTHERQCQCKDNQKYSITNINMDCPRTVTIWNYFPDDKMYPRISSQDKTYGKR